MADNQYTFENEQYRKTYWHTCSHILAQAVKRLYPEVKLAIGPSIDNGFYYDLDSPFPFTPEIMEQIEAEMRKICKEKLKMERFELPRAEALELMKDEPYKIELINDLPEDEVISFYKQGEFTDLCAGPHLDSTGRIKGNAIKLTACNAAYWRGDSSRETLQRIYGIAFPKKDQLDEYLAKVEENFNKALVTLPSEVKTVEPLTEENAYLHIQGHQLYKLVMHIGSMLCGGTGIAFKTDVLDKGLHTNGYEEIESLQSDLQYILK